MMALARDSRAESQTDLAAALSVGQGTISKYESGLSDPPADFVRDLASHLNYREDFFYEAGRPNWSPPFHYRKRAKLGVKALNKIHAEINIRRIHVEKLSRSYDRLPSLRIPSIDRDEYIGARRRPFSIEEVAAHVRDFWAIPRGPIANMVELIEDIGGIVIPCDFGSDLIDAMSQRINGMVLFFVNTNFPADRMRLTLAHELGHMILHTSDFINDEEMESEADEFAANILLPADEIKPQLRNKFEIRQLANLKRHWKVSMAAIAMRADKLNLVSQYQMKMFWVEMSRLGYRKREPGEPEKEHPRILGDMINHHTKRLGYSKDELSRMLHIFPSELDAMYGPYTQRSTSNERAPHLRLVK